MSAHYADEGRQGSRPAPEEAGVVAPVPGCRIDHVRREDVDDDGSDVVSRSTEGDSLDLQSSGGHFRDEGKCDGSAWSARS